MKIIRIIRYPYITELLQDTIVEFAKRGIKINIDQAHCLHDLIRWEGLSDVNKLVDTMIKEHLEILE